MKMRIAYLMSRFPKLTETFVLYEMLEVQRLGIDVQAFPLQRERAAVMHCEAAQLVDRACYTSWFSWAMLGAHWFYLRRNPWRYLSTLGTLLRSNWGSRRYLAGAVAFFPKAALMARRMQTAGVSHVHAHFASHPAAVAFVIHRLAGIPYSFTAHGSDLHRDRHMLREKVAEAALVVAISRYNRDLIVKHCGRAAEEKVQVVHCGVDTGQFRPREEPRLESAGERRPFSVYCIGTLHEVKGQRYLIEACRILRDRGLDVAVHLVGDGPDRGVLQRLAAGAGLADRVTLHGACRRDEVMEMLRQASAVAAPSVPTRDGRREGIPVALMEAMASGAAVVASSLSGIPELVEHDRTGLLAPPRDALALADALARLYSDPALRLRLARAGREKVLREFDLETNARRLAECFGELRGERRAADAPNCLLAEEVGA